MQTYGVMANVFYDFNLGRNLGRLPIVPYIGVGAGYAVAELGQRADRPPSTGRSVTIDGDDGNFAWQVIAGVAFPIQ